jgi:hypothetical protein
MALEIIMWASGILNYSFFPTSAFIGKRQVGSEGDRTLRGFLAFTLQLFLS